MVTIELKFTVADIPTAISVLSAIQTAVTGSTQTSPPAPAPAAVVHVAKR